MVYFLPSLKWSLKFFKNLFLKKQNKFLQKKSFTYSTKFFLSNKPKTHLKKKTSKLIYNKYFQYSFLFKKSWLLIGKSYSTYNSIFSQNNSSLSPLKLKQQSIFLKTKKNPLLWSIKKRLSPISLKTLNNKILFKTKSFDRIEEVKLQTPNLLYSKPYLFANLTTQIQPVITNFNYYLLFTTYLMYQNNFDLTPVPSQFSKIRREQHLLTNSKTIIKFNTFLLASSFTKVLNTPVKFSNEKNPRLIKKFKKNWFKKYLRRKARLSFFLIRKSFISKNISKLLIKRFLRFFSKFTFFIKKAQKRKFLLNPKEEVKLNYKKKNKNIKEKLNKINLPLLKKKKTLVNSLLIKLFKKGKRISHRFKFIKIFLLSSIFKNLFWDLNSSFLVKLSTLKFIKPRVFKLSHRDLFFLTKMHLKLNIYFDYLKSSTFDLKKNPLISIDNSPLKVSLTSNTYLSFYKPTIKVLKKQPREKLKRLKRFLKLTKLTKFKTKYLSLLPRILLHLFLPFCKISSFYFSNTSSKTSYSLPFSIQKNLIFNKNFKPLINSPKNNYLVNTNNNFSVDFKRFNYRFLHSTRDVTLTSKNWWKHNLKRLRLKFKTKSIFLNSKIIPSIYQNTYTQINPNFLNKLKTFNLYKSSNVTNLKKKTRRVLNQKQQIIFSFFTKVTKNLNFLVKNSRFFTNLLTSSYNQIIILKPLSYFCTFSSNTVNLKKQKFSLLKTKYNTLFSYHNLSFILPIYGFLFITKQEVLTNYNSILDLKKTSYSFFYYNDIKNFIISKSNLIKNYYSFFLNSLNFEENHYIPHKGFKNNSKPSFLFLLKNESSSLVFDSFFDEPDDFSISRIRFKPGYYRIWRNARNSLKSLLNLNFSYQHQLTRYLAKFYKLNRFTLFKYTELKLSNLLLFSNLVPDYSTSQLFINNKLIYVNGLLTTNSSLILVQNDLIQILVSIKYYVLFKWLTNWSLLKKLKINQLLISNQSKATNLSKKNLPEWLLKNLTFDYDIPKYLEVDYLTLSAFILYEPYKITDYNPLFQKFSKLPIYNLYNWKYIT